MDQPPGRREQHKRETRAALQAAADRLFGERGYQATTVRDIAEAAGVTERTFFRYFAAKEELALPAALGWLQSLADAVRTRPDDEDAVTAVKAVVLALERLMRASEGPTLLSLYAEKAPAEVMAADSVRRLRFLATETALAPALRERLVRDGLSDDDLLDFRAESLARTCVALVRSALLCDLARRRSGAPEGPALRDLLDLAFTDLHRGWHA